MKKALIIFASLFMFTTSSFAMNLNLQNEVLDILVEFEAGELRVEDQFKSTELVYLNNWPRKVLKGLGDYLNKINYYGEEDLARLSYEDPSGEYGLIGRIQRSLEVNVGGEKAYIAYYLFIGGEWGREEVFHTYYVLDSQGEIVTKGSYDRDYDYFEIEEQWNN